MVCTKVRSRQYEGEVEDDSLHLLIWSKRYGILCRVWSRSKSVFSSGSPASSTLDDHGDVLSAVGQSACHLSCQNVSKVGEGLASAFELLIEFLYQFDKFAGIDVRVSRTFDVFDDFWWEAGRKDAGGLAQGEQILDQTLARMACQCGVLCDWEVKGTITFRRSWRLLFASRGTHGPGR